MKSTSEKRIKRIRRGAKTKAIQKRVADVRLVAHRSGKHIYGQIIQSQPKGDIVIVSCSSLDAEIVANHTNINKVDKALEVGKLLAARAIEKQVSSVAFDRGGYKYHGRIEALAKGAREAGLNF